MNDRTKRILWIGGSVLVIGGIVYFFWRKNKKAKELAMQTSTDAAITPAVTPTPTPSSVSTPMVQVPTQLNTSDKIKAFQDWMDKNKPLWVFDKTDGKYKNLRVGTPTEPTRHINGKGYGNFGPATATAWKTFGNLYLGRSSSSTISPLDLVFSRFVGVANTGTMADGSKYAWFNLAMGKYQIKFFNNGRFILFTNTKPEAMIAKGAYSNGGRTLQVTEGAKAGNTYTSNSFWTTIKNLI